jgi:phage terminase small subunit
MTQNKTPTLTAKQSRFVDEYLIDLNATKAAIRAGYSAKTAQAISTENLSKPLIQAAIAERIEERAQRTKRTSDDVLRDLALVRASAMTIVLDKADNKVMLNPHVALRALELEGKHLAMWADKTMVDIKTEQYPLQITSIDPVEAARQYCEIMGQAPR